MWGALFANSREQLQVACPTLSGILTGLLQYLTRRGMDVCHVQIRNHASSFYFSTLVVCSYAEQSSWDSLSTRVRYGQLIVSRRQPACRRLRRLPLTSWLTDARWGQNHLWKVCFSPFCIMDIRSGVHNKQTSFSPSSQDSKISLMSWLLKASFIERQVKETAKRLMASGILHL